MAHRRDRLLAMFATHRDELQRFLVRRLRNFALAEDLTQETWVRIATAGGTAEIANPRSYLFRVAANLAFDHQHRVSRHIEVHAAAEAVAAVADPRPTPEAVAVHRSELDQLRVAVNGLAPRCREVFVLAKLDGLTYGQIAARLGISRNTVVSHMVHALTAIERRLASRRIAD